MRARCTAVATVYGIGFSAQWLNLKMQGLQALDWFGVDVTLPDGPTIRVGPAAAAAFSLGNALDHAGRTINGTGRAMGNPLKFAGRKLMVGATGVRSDVYNIKGYSDTLQPVQCRASRRAPNR